MPYEYISTAVAIIIIAVVAVLAINRKAVKSMSTPDDHTPGISKRSNGTWRVRKTIDKVTYNVGTYGTKDEAIKALGRFNWHHLQKF